MLALQLPKCIVNKEEPNITTEGSNQVPKHLESRYETHQRLVRLFHEATKQPVFLDSTEKTSGII